MVRATDLVVWLKEVDKDDSSFVGGKAANLGEMIAARFPVPYGFVITSYAYCLFLKENNLSSKLRHLLATIDYNNPDSLQSISKIVKKLIVGSPVPENIVKSVFSYYQKLGNNPLIAIRSSATSEDPKTASFAGQQATFLNVKGESSILHSVREAWASLFEARAMFYRHENHIDHLKVGISLVVQKMVNSESSGVMFTVNPVNNDKSRIIIESIWGLGENIVQGKVTPDHYEVDKKTNTILNKEISSQSIKLKLEGNLNMQVHVGRFFQKKQKISDADIKTLAKVGSSIEKHYYFPQDIEWAKEKGELFIVQTRPITTLVNKTEDLRLKTYSLHPILVGDPASPGIGIGPVKIIHKTKEIGKINQGDVLVAPFTSPDYVPAMKKAAAIVTEKGGRTSHAAIVSREFGIPAVVGVEKATKVLAEHMVVTVNGKSGEVFKGSCVPVAESNVCLNAAMLKTSTKLYVNVSEPDVAVKVAEANVDGVGLLRAEFMIAQIGIHPKRLIKEKKGEIFVDQLVRNLETICGAFYPRPVYYRTTDFKTNEYRNLKGGAEFEPVEPNPMLGYRGAFRYLHDPDVFRLELEVIKRVRERKELHNLHLMIPFLRTPQELSKVKKIIVEQGLRRSSSFQLIIMVEIPSNVILIEDFISEGIDGVSIGSNDLTMLLLGTDRDNEEVSLQYFDERNEAVLWAFEKVIKTCRRYGLKTSICGQAPSLFPELVEKLVKWGITSISVSPDAIENARATIYRIEKGMAQAFLER